ncbi:MAG: PEGA domain-containing protein [Myxococcales bacterium]|nr:PEGA domain-containing protein [Myxococcales bacterium]
MRRSVSVLLLALGLCLMARPAAAQGKSTVQVLAIGSEDAFEQAQALTIALKRGITRTEGWALHKGDYSLEVMTAALGCPLPPDANCQKKISDKVGATRYIWGTLAKSGKKQVVAVLRLWENGSQKKDVEIKYASNLTDPSDDTLMSIATDAFAKLTGEATGIVVVTAGGVNGKVFVDGEEVGTVTDGRTELTLPSGEHKIMVKADGFNDALGTVTVRAGSSAEVTLNPTPVGSGQPANGDPTGDHGKSGGNNKLLGYIGVGVGGALVLTGTYFGIKTLSQKNDAAYEDFRKGSVPDGEDACKYAESKGRDDIVEFCDKNKRDKTLFWVLTPVGAVITGVGVYFLATSGDKSEGSKAKLRHPRVQPLVGLGPGGGELRVNVAF